MTLVVRPAERTQRAVVERVLVEDGRISAHEAMFDLRTADGERKSITRLAAVIDTLRKANWEIETIERSGEQAVYVLRGRPAIGRPVGALRTCPSCHSEHHVGTTCLIASVPERSGPASPLPAAAPLRA
jgi:hypothetical protein